MLLQTAAFWLSPFLFSVATSTVRAAVAASGAPASMTANTKVSPMKPAWAILDSDRDDKCPPCFNCMLPSFTCMQFGRCSEYNGQCVCPDGFGGQDCSKPLDGSLADGKQRYPRDGNESHCKDGWSGLLCNVCETDEACRPLVSDDDDTIRPDSRLVAAAANEDRRSPAVCYKGGIVVNKMHQMCDVTNRKILDMLPDRKPQVTFSCDKADSTCGFQFWVGGIESFYCGLEECAVRGEALSSTNVTHYDCKTVKCSCIPDRMLCGEAGSVNIDDFLAEEIKGPGSFSCRSDGSGCYFTEPAMNTLINDIFGDEYITLRCNSGECLHYSAVPGFSHPALPDNSKLVAASIAAAGLIVVIACALFWYLGRTHKGETGAIRLSEGSDPDDPDKAVAAHKPSTLAFSELSYTAPNGRNVLSDVTGTAQPGQLLAIMGASGAGKSTLLDILAKKTKRGLVRGSVTVNGKAVTSQQYRRLAGFVDQEDTLMGTLTVYETVLYSALLRLPRDLPLESKKLRTLEALNELGILGIKDSRIGESGKRSISGGEKRRVSIACELVTSPAILFLDEPTSGLDAYNAKNVVECLSNLAKMYNRTVVFTIHQPRSNIVSLFDQLLLLASGQVVYAGSYAKCQTYFEGIGHACPPGYNIADYLIDLTMQDEKPIEGGLPLEGELDEEAPTPSSGRTAIADRSAHLASLVDAYRTSDIAKEIRQTSRDGVEQSLGSGVENTPEVKRATWWTQFTILSGRAFKNLYRNPMLMLSHYAISIVVSLLCSFLFAHVTNDIPGFQNRMGLFFFVLALFGFSCLTSLDAFASERILFMRERSNGYYSPATYFAAKVLFDLLPLRIIPPFILGAIIYRPVGLVPALAEFWKLVLILVMFNLSASSVIFFISIVISNTGVANLVGSLVMLFNLLFAGLLVNRDKVPLGVGWLQTTSFFHAAFEALLVNEVRYLQLKDHRYGVDIEIPAATILSMFGFRAQAFWWPDFLILCLYFGGFILLSYLALLVVVKERR